MKLLPFAGEADASNNKAHRLIHVRSHAEIQTSPIVQSFALNNGFEDTTQRTIPLSIDATAEVGSASESMLFTEVRYFPGVRSWIGVQNTGWILYSSASSLALSMEGGAHFIRAWVRETLGNISNPRSAYINYLPNTESLRKDQIRLYRKLLKKDQSLTATLNASKGNADLHIGGPGGLAGSGTNAGTLQDLVSFSAGQSGIYWVAVIAVEDSIYSISFSGAASANLTRPLSATGLNPADALPPISTSNDPPLDSECHPVNVAEPERYPVWHTLAAYSKVGGGSIVSP